MSRFFFLICLCFLTLSNASTYVAVLETISENNVLGRSERLYLTDKLRDQAGKALPAYLDYVIMTRENINAMLPPGKAIEDCEGSCLAETGRNIAADYVAQARVGQFGSQLTLTIELYEIATNKLVGSFTCRKPDADGLLEEMESHAEDVFKVVRKDFGIAGQAGMELEGISNVTSGSAKGSAESVGFLDISPRIK